MIKKLTLRELPRTDDSLPLGAEPVWRWAVVGLPHGESVDITESNGAWRIQRVHGGMLENDPREFPTAEAAFAVLVDEYSDGSG